jgi:ParB-like chromosome segregation protein Spo0J
MKTGEDETMTSEGKIEQAAERVLKWVRAGKIHRSTVLPPRVHGLELAASVEEVGILQPLLVRSIPGKTDEFEVVDGLGRLLSVKDEQIEVLVDVISCVKGSDVFGKSEATFQRTDRSAYEKCLFYAAWARELENEMGKSDGVQASLAREAHLSEGAISQYITIDNLFAKLESLAPGEEFDALKTWGVNKLFRLSQLVECERLLEIAREFEATGEVSIEEVERVVSENRPLSRALAALDEDQHETTNETQSKRAQLLVEEVNSLATETHQLLSTIAEELLANVDAFSTAEVLGVYDRVLNALKRLRKRAETLRQKINDHRQQPADSSELGEK